MYVQKSCMHIRTIMEPLRTCDLPETLKQVACSSCLTDCEKGERVWEYLSFFHVRNDWLLEEEEREKKIGRVL